MRPPVSLQVLSFAPGQRCAHHNSESYQIWRSEWFWPHTQNAQHKMWYIGGGETLRIAKLASKDLHPVFLDSIFISFHATDKQVKRATSLRWKHSSSSLGTVCSLDASTAQGRITVPLPTQGFSACFRYQSLPFLFAFPLAFAPNFYNGI